MADQSRVLHQDKMMSLGRLAASVVHEINNPLAGVLNYLRLMIRQTEKMPATDPLRPQFLRYLELSESETARCSHIVSNLLSFSRLRPPAMDRVPLAELVERSAVLSRHKLELSNIALVLDVEPGLPDLYGDINQLQQCLINLVFNAVDAMPEGGRLTISAHKDADRGLALIQVSDTGQGIAPEDLPRIFEPFFTTKKDGYGVGLGLSTVYGIVDRHGGRIRVESRLGEGARFTLELPIPV
jgi:signal transduction histidine kinase